MLARTCSPLGFEITQDAAHPRDRVAPRESPVNRALTGQPALAFELAVTPSPNSTSPTTDQHARDTPPSRSTSASRRLSWAELLKRVFEIDVLACPRCGARRELIATITDGPVARRILEHLGLPADPPPLAPARTPSEPAFEW